jgi:hypothetical protein
MDIQTVTLAQLAALEVDRDDVPHETRAAAFTALWEVGRALKLAALPRLRFLAGADGRRLGLRGVVDPSDVGSIWVVIQPPADVTETVCHEALHVQQINRWGSYVGEPDSPFSMASRETAATSFGLAIRARYEQGRRLVDPAPKRPAPPPARRGTPVLRPGPGRDLSRAAVPAVTVRSTHAPAAAEGAPLERKIHTTGALRWVSCSTCSGVALVGELHRCPAARREARRHRP